MKKVIDIILIVIFMLVLVVPIMFVNRDKFNYLESEKRVAEKFPEMVMENGDFVLDLDGVESWLTDNIGFRNSLVNLNSFIQVDLLNKSIVDKVYVGLDDWYFYTLGNNLKIADESYELTDIDLSLIAMSQLKISEYFTSLGIEYYLVVVPSKVSIYPEKILYNMDYTKTPVDYLEEKLNDVDVNYIYLKDVLINAKDDQLVYFKNDTHWNNYGTYIGYKKIIDHLNDDLVINDFYAKVDLIETEGLNDLSVMLSRLDEKYYSVDIDILDENVELLDEEDSLYSKFNLFGSSYINKSKDLDLLIYGDSFTESTKMRELLATNFNETDFLRTKIISKQHITESSPDVVIFEIAERHVDQLKAIRIVE